MNRFDDVCTVQGDDVAISFTVYDRNQNLVDLAGAVTTFRIAPMGSNSHVLELNNDLGITYNGSVLTVSFNSCDMPTLNFCGQPFITYEAQLRITLGDKTMVAAQGRIIIEALIK